MSDQLGGSEREQTLTALVEKYRVLLLGIIRERMQDQIEAEDVLYDVFIEFVEEYDLGHAIETVSAWLVRVAQNKIVDRFRRRKTQAEYRAAVLAFDGMKGTVASIVCRGNNRVTFPELHASTDCLQLRNVQKGEPLND